MKTRPTPSQNYTGKYTDLWPGHRSFSTFSSMLRKRRAFSGKKYRILFCICMIQVVAVFSQATYDNFEGNKLVSYSEKGGVLDTAASNPAPDKVNPSSKCALYVRNQSKKFDNIKMKLNANLVDVSPYATYLGVPPCLKMKVYTTAPAGTLVEILLGSRRGNGDYPAGTNSQYQAYTTKSNSWEELAFKFSQIPQGSETATTQVDQVTLLFSPNSNTSDTYYFDEINGPSLVGWPPEKIASPGNEKPVKKTQQAKKTRTNKKTAGK